jgi:RNA polymerase sigma-B factor
MSASLAEVVVFDAAGRSNEELLARYAADRSAATLDRLVRANQRLLHHILKRFAYADEQYEDLLQVANVGLIKAAQKYDPAHGVRFVTYATAIIDGEIRHYLRDSLLMRQPRWLRRVYTDINHAVIELGNELGRPPEVAQLAERVNLTEEGLLEVMGLYSRIDLHSWDEPFTQKDLAAGIDAERIHSRHYESFALPIEDRIALEAALEKLTDFERRLIELLFYREFTQREVAEALGVTTKKVSRELGKTLVRLKELMGRRVF